MSTELKLDHKDPDLFFAEISHIVVPVIEQLLNHSVDQKRQALVNYQVATGGKRLRPALATASCLACGGKVDDVLYPAAGLEILHNCSLIYDDMIDHSSLRRGRATVWARFGRSIAQCVGLNHSAAIFQAANRSPYPSDISEIFAVTLKIIVEGEIEDILLEQWGRDDEEYVVDNRAHSITQADYLRMVGKKTASLLQASCEVGAISAGAEARHREALRRYGFNLGVAFQIGDDILDISGEQRRFGKKIGKDIEERKLGNIMVLYALEELASSEEENELRAILGSDHVEDGDVQRAITLISNTGAREESLLLERQYIGRAKDSLQELPDNAWSNFLGRVADFVIERNS